MEAVIKSLAESHPLLPKTQINNRIKEIAERGVVFDGERRLPQRWFIRTEILDTLVCLANIWVLLPSGHPTCQGQTGAIPGHNGED